MSQYNDELYRLQKQIERAAQLRALIPELQQRRKHLTECVKALHKSMLREQRDVDRLEGRGLTALYYHAVGKQESQLDKERREADSIREQYDTAAAELNALEAELQQAEAELAGLDGCEAQYQALLTEKLALLKACGGEAAEHIHSMENRINKLELQKTEVRDAIVAGNTALRAANQIKACLDGAEKQSIGDLASDGILSGVFDLGKRSKLKEAKALVGDFRFKLSGFQDKLAKITVTTGIRINVEDFHHFGDYFFDGLFADYSFHNKLKSAQEELENARKKIAHTITSLEELITKLSKDQERTRTKLDMFVLKDKIP